MGICFSNNNDSVLLNLHDVDVEMFSLNGMTFNAKVVDVYDGDTCTVIFYYKDEPIKFKCRCKGYDSPEMKPPKDAKNRDDIIKNANLAKIYENVVDLKVSRERVILADEFERTNPDGTDPFYKE